MNTKKIVKETKLIMFSFLIVGLLLLAVGIIFSVFKINIIQNNKAITGLSFIPLSLALTYFIKLLLIKKSPKNMHDVIIFQYDERLVAIRNEADAKAFRILHWILFMVFMGYTLIIPDDIFESVGWWIILGLLLISYMLQVIFSILSNRKS